MTMSEQSITNHMLPAFASPIVNYHWSDTEKLNQSLMDVILSMQGQTGGVTKSNIGAWHSALDFLDSQHDAVLELRQRLVKLVTELNQQVLRQDVVDQAHRFRLEGWANVLRNGGYNTVHNHPNAFWSGCYYVNDNEVLREHPFSGKLELLDPRPGASLTYSEKTNLYGRFLLSPNAGQIIIFPAWLQHLVHPYFGQRERISIAFNVLL